MLTLTDMLFVCCTYICFVAAHTVHIRCTHAAHTIHPYCMCCIQKIGSAPHAFHIHAHEVAHISLNVCNMCAIGMCSIHAVVYLFMYSIHAACKQLHTNCIHFFICLYGMRVVLNQFLCTRMHAIWMYCVCSTRAAYMCNMCRCARMQYICCIHA